MDKSELNALRHEFKELQAYGFRADIQRNNSGPRQWRVVSFSRHLTETFYGLAMRAAAQVGPAGSDEWLEYLAETIERPTPFCHGYDGDTRITLETLPDVARLSVLAIDRLLAIPAREQNGNSVKPFSGLTLPTDVDLRDLWTRLAEGHGKGKSDRKIAREFSASNGEKWLRNLITKRNRDEISDWKPR